MRNPPSSPPLPRAASSHRHEKSQWLFTEPEQNVFNFTEGEVVAAKAAEAGYYLRCHALVWHSQLAPWVESSSANWTADALRDAITAHITAVAGHWKGRCYAWDVVNEALNEDGTYRESVFYNVLGRDYIRHAFEVASSVDPAAKLYYNDYNLESPGKKSEAAVGIVKTLRAAGVRIDGIGMQAHLTAESHPTLDQHVAVIKSYADAGVEVALTELDVRITLPATEEKLELQKQAYKNVSFGPVLPSCRGACLTFTSSARRGLRPGQGLRRRDALGLLRPLQLGAGRLSWARRASALVRQLHSPSGVRRHRRGAEERE